MARWLTRYLYSARHIRTWKEPYSQILFMEDMRRHPAFCDWRSNHEIEAVLREAKVIWPSSETGTRREQLLVLFSSHRSGKRFIRRLNQWIEEKG